MRSRFVTPETTRLDLSDGDYVIVRVRLNTGELRASVARQYLTDADGQRRFDALQAGIATVLAYLVDWSLTDAEGKPVVIRGLPADAVARILDNLDPESFAEIRDAIDAHEARGAEARAEEKKRRNGTPAAPTSPSPPVAAGASSGFVN